MIKLCYSIHFSSKSSYTVYSQFSNPFSVPFLPFSSHLIQYYHHFSKLFPPSSFVPILISPSLFQSSFCCLSFSLSIFFSSHSCFPSLIQFHFYFVIVFHPTISHLHLSNPFFVPSHCPHCLSPFHAHVIILSFSSPSLKLFMKNRMSDKEVNLLSN